MISKRTIHGWTPFWCRLRAFVAMAVLCVDAAEMWSAEHNPQSAAVAERPAAHGIEVVRERYLDGRVKTEREVTTDAEGNYVNHGAWRMWNPAGKLVAEGAYSMGQRTGEWTKWLGREEASLLSDAPFDQFDAPFASRAAFVADQMDGEWTISDASGRKCSTVQLKNGRRHGTATLWLATGQSYREASFRNALPAGDLRELDADGKIKTIASYVGGQQLVNRVTYYPNSEQKRIESACLGASIVEIVPDDFWQLQFAQYAVHGSN